jgi:hypothetical protein
MLSLKHCALLDGFLFPDLVLHSWVRLLPSVRLDTMDHYDLLFIQFGWGVGKRERRETTLLISKEPRA